MTATTPHGSTQRVERFVIIVHPCPYEIYFKPAPGSPHFPYRQLEIEVLNRWLAAAQRLDPALTFVVQIDMPDTAAGPDALHSTCVRRVGASRVCRVPGEYHDPSAPERLLDYYARIHAMVETQLARHELSFDAATCAAELWGQSFEGCAPGYGTALCRRLRLARPLTFDFAMSVPDAPFLLGARGCGQVAVPGSDVVAYVFNLSDGTTAALFQSRATDQWLDRRAIEVRVDPTRSWLSDKKGNRVEGAPDGVLRVASADERFIRSRGEDLAVVVRRATVPSTSLPLQSPDQ